MSTTSIAGYVVLIALVSWLLVGWSLSKQPPTGWGGDEPGDVKRRAVVRVVLWAFATTIGLVFFFAALLVTEVVDWVTTRLSL